jgi:hypothetical protein
MRTGKQSHQAAVESEEFAQDRLQQAVIKSAVAGRAALSFMERGDGFPNRAFV